MSELFASKKLPVSITFHIFHLLYDCELDTDLLLSNSTQANICCFPPLEIYGDLVPN